MYVRQAGGLPTVYTAAYGPAAAEALAVLYKLGENGKNMESICRRKGLLPHLADLGCPNDRPAAEDKPAVALQQEALGTPNLPRRPPFVLSPAPCLSPCFLVCCLYLFAENLAPPSCVRILPAPLLLLALLLALLVLLLVLLVLLLVLRLIAQPSPQAGCMRSTSAFIPRASNRSPITHVSSVCGSLNRALSVSLFRGAGRDLAARHRPGRAGQARPAACCRGRLRRKRVHSLPNPPTPSNLLLVLVRRRDQLAEERQHEQQHEQEQH